MVDVAVIGAGYTGLHAALQTARGGRSTLVLDAEDAGWGCSTRNGGQVSTSIKPSFEQLGRRYGPQRAFNILKEGHRSLEFIERFIRSEGIDCDFGRVGRFHAAHNAAQYEALAQRVSHQPSGLELPAHMVPRSPVTGILRESNGFRAQTARGQVLARDVVVATNGYTGTVTPWLRRRVIPVGSYMIATEELPPGLMDRLIPRNRIVSDTRKDVYYYRASPDRKRIVFGGRVSHVETDPRVRAPLLHAAMVKVFPELAATRISHSWCGLVAYTFDELMHLGKRDGIHYATGYCGAGVGTSSYFGMRIGQQVLGLPEGRTALDRLVFQTRPLYSGNPWFLAPSVMSYRWCDRRGR